MYSRQMLEVPECLIKNGKAVFGTFNGPVSKLDIRGLHAPFGGVPLPSFISNFRIKSSLTFNFRTEQFFGSVLFFDSKLFGICEVNLWNTETGRKYVYKSIMGPRRRFIPHNLNQGFCASFNRHRYVRISWDHTRDRFSIILNVKGDSVRPSLQAALTGSFSDPATSEITQCIPICSKRRCAASYFATFRMRGSLTLGKTKKSEEISLKVENCSADFFVNRAYYSYVSTNQLIHGTGITDGKQISFLIENIPDSAPDPEVINRNLIVVDGKFTPLPPVKMTYPYGMNDKWFIQDTENMVDLTFIPASKHVRDINTGIMKMHMNVFYGQFEGVIKTKEGDDICISGFGGIARDQMIRI